MEQDEQGMPRSRKPILCPASEALMGDKSIPISVPVENTAPQKLFSNTGTIRASPHHNNYRYINY